MSQADSVGAKSELVRGRSTSGAAVDRQRSGSAKNEAVAGLMAVEERNVGSVKATVWLGYAAYAGVCWSLAIAVNYALFAPVTAGTDWWLTQWTSTDLQFVPHNLWPVVNHTASPADVAAATAADKPLTMFYLSV